MQNLGMNLGCVGSGHPVGVWTPPTRPEAPSPGIGPGTPEAHFFTSIFVIELLCFFMILGSSLG